MSLAYLSHDPLIARLLDLTHDATSEHSPLGADDRDALTESAGMFLDALLAEHSTELEPPIDD